MDIAREVAAVVFVLALLGGVLWAMRRGISFSRGISFKGSVRARRLETIERVALTPQHALHLVRFDGKELVISTHPQGCSAIKVGRTSRSAAGLLAGTSTEPARRPAADQEVRPTA